MAQLQTENDMNFSILYDIIISVFLIGVLFVNIYFTFKLNRKIKELKMYTKKLPELTSYVQKTLEAFGKSLVDLRDSSEKIQKDVGDKNARAEELIEELKILLKSAEKNIKYLENANTTFNRSEINFSPNQTLGPRKQKINSVLDLIDNG